MTANLGLRFLGPIQVEREGQLVPDLLQGKPLALLGYLVVRRQPLSREHLADLFWQDLPAQRGRANLSWTLHKLSTILPGCLQAHRHTVAFCHADDCWIDLDAFQALIAQGGAGSLTETAALYRGEFLQGLSVDGCADFELWLLSERERWRQRAERALDGLIAHHGGHGAREEALRYARRLLALAPWREETHRTVMRLLALNGQRSAALVQYEACRRALRDELDVEPGEETTRLYERIRDGELAPDPSIAPSLPAVESPIPREGSSLPLAATSRTEGLRGERRMVTALLALVTGLSAQGEPVDVETRAEVMNCICNIVGDEVDRYGGEVDRYRDDGLVTLFGASTAHEDDPERAVLAALGIQQAIQPYAAELSKGKGIALSLHVGINTGQVIAAQLDHRVQYWEASATERALALAARTEAPAEPIAILVARETWQLVAPLFEWERVAGTDPGGVAYRPLARRVRPDKGRGIKGLASPLVGRGAELQVLQEVLGRLQQGIGGIVTLVGEAGIGKSRLVAEVRERGEPAGLKWVEGRCLSYATNVAYQIWLDVLRTLLVRLGIAREPSPAVMRDVLEERVQALCPGDHDQVYPYLAQMMSLPLEEDTKAMVRGLDAESIQFVTFRAVETVLERVAQKSPLVLVCEDLHWADPTSLTLLEHLLPLVDRVALLLVCVFRPESEHRCWALKAHATQHYPHCHTDLWLKPLTMADSATLVGNLLYVKDLPPVIRERILEHAGGNPFYVEEILRALIDNGSLVHDEMTGHWQAAREVFEIPIPDTLRGVIAARIDHLPGEAKHLLQMASAIGRIFTSPVLAAVAGPHPSTRGPLAALQEALHEPGTRWELDAHLLAPLVALERAQLIRERARLPVREYAFKHVLTQEAAYSSLLERDQRAYHGIIAAALERLYSEHIEEQLGLLAHHWEQAGETRQAIDYLRRAGEQAAAQFANDEAIDYLCRALDLTPESDLSGRYTLLLAREGVHDVQGARESQRQDLAALASVAQALGDERRRAQVALRKTQYAFAIADHAASIAAAREAITLAQVTGDVACEAAAHLQWGITLRRVSDYAAATHVLERTLALTRSASLREMEADALRALGFVSGYRGDATRARKYVEQSLDLCRQIASPKTEGRVLCTLSMVIVSVGQGDYGAARTHALRALRIFQEIGYRWGQGEALWCLSFVSLCQGDYAQARTLLDQQLQIGRETHNAGRESRALADLGLLAHCLDDHESACAYSRRGLQAAEECGNLWYQAYALLVMGHALAGLGQFVEAVDTYLKALGLYRGLDFSHWTIDLLAGLARVALARGQHKEALAYIEQILRHLSTYPKLEYTWEPLRVCLTCYHVLRAVQDPRTEEILNAAYQLLQERAAMVEDEGLRRSYLEDVPYHRDVVTAWEQENPKSLGGDFSR